MNKHHFSRWIVAGALMTLASACADDTKKTEAPADATTTPDAANDQGSQDGATATAQDVVSMDAQSDSAAADSTGNVTPVAKRLAVVGSDFKSASVSLIDLATAAVTANVLNSGTVVSPGNTALSGDIAVTQSPTLDGKLVLIDRGSSVLSWLDPVSLKVTQQINVATGFYANAQDYVQVSPTRAYVTRFGVNAKPTADAGDFDEGDDVVVLDLVQKKIVDRIALTPLASKAGVLANGGRMAFAGGVVWIPLANLSADFKDAGTGRVIGIDAATAKVLYTVDAPESKNCAKAATLPGSNKVAVICQGFFGDAANQINFSNVLTIDTTAKPPVAKVAVTAISLGGKSNLPKGPLGKDISFVDATRGVVTTAAKGADLIWAIDLATGAGEKIGAGGGEFAISGVFADPVSMKVYVGEAYHAGGDVRVFDLSKALVTELPAIASNPKGLGAVDLGGF